MANLTDLFAQGAQITSTDARAGTTATDSATSQADYLIVFPFGTGGNDTARGVLYGIDGQNNASAEKWLFVFDAATVPVNATGPFTGATLLHVIDLPPNTTAKGSFSYKSGTSGGEAFATGLVLAVSTTGPTQLTIDTAKTTYISVHYGVSYPGF